MIKGIEKGGVGVRNWVVAAVWLWLLWIKRCCVAFLYLLLLKMLMSLNCFVLL